MTQQQKSLRFIGLGHTQTGAVTPATGVAAGDTDDTADGVAAKTLTVPVTITGVQTQPSATAIP